MEDILDLYHLPYDPARPVITMDEQPYQRLANTRELLPMRPGAELREDYEYERCGTASIFMFSEPLGRWRRTSVRERRTAGDWAEEVRFLLEEDFPHVEKIVLICDNLNTHSLSSLYKAFPAQKARELAKRLEIHFTPKHGSWLNVAECELSALTRQSLQQRIPTIEKLDEIVTAWTDCRNKTQKTVDWQFSTEDARIKLKSLYPQTQL